MIEPVSDWVCICTSGHAIDGRFIDKACLKESAVNYERKKYTAMIWGYHTDDIESRQFTENLGMVDSVKYEEKDGVGKLYARLEPNEQLKSLNRAGQKLFTSAEFWPDFAGSGQWYLHGVSVTDIPASLHTSRLQFTAKRPQGLCSAFHDILLPQNTTPTPRERRLKAHHFVE